MADPAVRAAVYKKPVIIFRQTKGFIFMIQLLKQSGFRRMFAGRSKSMMAAHSRIRTRANDESSPIVSPYLTAIQLHTRQISRTVGANRSPINTSSDTNSLSTLHRTVILNAIIVFASSIHKIQREDRARRVNVLLTARFHLQGILVKMYGFASPNSFEM